MNEPYYWVKYFRVGSIRYRVRYFYEIENAIRFVSRFSIGSRLSDDGRMRLVAFRIPGY